MLILMLPNNFPFDEKRKLWEGKLKEKRSHPTSLQNEAPVYSTAEVSLVHSLSHLLPLLPSVLP